MRRARTRSERAASNVPLLPALPPAGPARPPCRASGSSCSTGAAAVASDLHVQRLANWEMDIIPRHRAGRRCGAEHRRASRGLPGEGPQPLQRRRPPPSGSPSSSGRVPEPRVRARGAMRSRHERHVRRLHRTGVEHHRLPASARPGLPRRALSPRTERVAAITSERPGSTWTNSIRSPAAPCSAHGGRRPPRSGPRTGGHGTPSSTGRVHLPPER